MTRQARIVLADCKEALADLVDGVQGSEWRRRWVTVVVLLRVVGHVLHKVDSDISDKMKDAIAAEHNILRSTKPKPEIYWLFIEQERNNIVKEYRIGAGQGVTVHLGTQPATASYHYPITAGPFAGRDQRDVITEAIQWWEDYLDRIDRSVITKP